MQKRKSRPEVLCSVRLSKEALTKLEEVAEVETRFTARFLSSKQELLKIVGRFDGVIIGASEPFDREVINVQELRRPLIFYYVFNDQNMVS